MKSSSIYLGITIVKTNDNGATELAYHGHGPDYHGLDESDLVAIEGALSPLAEKYDGLAREAEQILLKAGFAKAGVNQEQENRGKN
jgi:hypothetical protein